MTFLHPLPRSHASNVAPSDNARRHRPLPQEVNAFASNPCKQPRPRRFPRCFRSYRCIYDVIIVIIFVGWWRASWTPFSRWTRDAWCNHLVMVVLGFQGLKPLDPSSWPYGTIGVRLKQRVHTRMATLQQVPALMGRNCLLCIQWESKWEASWDHGQEAFEPFRGFEGLKNPENAQTAGLYCVKSLILVRDLT